jgi:hypothetical protein
VDLLVRLGRPVVWGASFGDTIQWVEANDEALDTMFYRWSGGETSIMVEATDSNGTIEMFYWDYNDDNQGVNETSDVPYQPTLIENTLYKYSAWVKDDDSLRSSNIVFYVYADAAPEAPLQISESELGTDSVKLTWSGNDEKDGDSLHFQILCDKSNPPSTEVKPFGTCKKSGDDFYVVIPINSDGRYYWKVTARDARGSETASLSVGVFDFPLP